MSPVFTEKKTASVFFKKTATSKISQPGGPCWLGDSGNHNHKKSNFTASHSAIGLFNTVSTLYLLNDYLIIHLAGLTAIDCQVGLSIMVMLQENPSTKIKKKNRSDLEQ